VATRILIADDHAVVRSGVRRILEDDAKWSVVAEAADGREAITKAIATKPDIAILDYALPLIDGIEVARQIRLRMPSIEVLIFTMHDNANLLRNVVKAGARGYVLKSDAQQHLIAAVQALATHKPYFVRQTYEDLLKALRTDGRQFDQSLTSREQTILRLVAEGHRNKQIAKTLNIAPKTVELHRAAILRKLDLASSAALVRNAIRNKVIEA
jgi:DNA-binding NarL/FixJ family response regulator